MKYITFLFIAMLTFSSCTDFLDKEPDDMLTLEKVFNNRQNTLEWLSAIYSSVPNTFINYHQEGPLSDDMAPHAEWTGWFAYDIVGKQMGNWNPSSEDNNDYWRVLPKKIRQAQIFIQNVKPLENQNLTLEEAERMKLEARFLIAYYYALLVEFYGAVPFTAEPIDLDAPYDVLMMQQVPVHQVIDWIDNE